VSAGSHPRALHPNALRVMREDYGLDLSAHAPTPLGALAGQAFDRVISLCDRVREVCPEFPGRPHTIHWSIPDPAAEPVDAADPDAAFERTAQELETRIRLLLHQIGHDSQAQEVAHP